MLTVQQLLLHFLKQFLFVFRPLVLNFTQPLLAFLRFHTGFVFLDFAGQLDVAVGALVPDHVVVQNRVIFEAGTRLFQFLVDARVRVPFVNEAGAASATLTSLLQN